MRGASFHVGIGYLVASAWISGGRVEKRSVKSTNAKNAREAFGGVCEKEVPIPLCIGDCSQYMGGAGATGQFRSRMTQASFRTRGPVAHTFLGMRHYDYQSLGIRLTNTRSSIYRVLGSWL